MNSWFVAQVPFKFQLSDWTWFRFNLNLQCSQVRLSDPGEPVLQPVAPDRALPADCAGYLIRSLPVQATLPALSTQGDYLVYVRQHYPRYFIDLNQSFEDYKAKFSAKTRSTINRKIKKFAEHCGGSLDWRQYTRPEEMGEFLKLARQVSALTYQEKLLDAGIPNSEAFTAEVMQLAAQDLVRAYIIFHEGKPVSYLYCPIEEGVLVYSYLGYDPSFMKLSVGTVLQWQALETIFAEGKHKYFDFTEGESEHKKLFATDHRQCADVFFIRRSLAHWLLVQGHRHFNAAVEKFGEFLERHNLKTRIRQWMRFGA